MKRDIIKAVEQGMEVAKNQPNLDLSAYEFNRIKEMSMAAGGSTVNVIYHAIINAYRAGLAVGIRNGK